MTGKKFLKLLSRRSIPYSVFAAKCRTNLEKIHALETVENIPSKYKHILLEHFSDQLKEKDLLSLDVQLTAA